MKVSIAMVTYNHEQYIAKALDSVLMQKTNFDYEIVIGEDCSTDGTRAIVIDYQHRYPDKFRLLLNETNLGMHKNADQTINACKGEYVAMLDGDDHWTAPYKLQKQVDFLESHPECSICFHDSIIVYEDGSKEPSHYRPSQKEFSTVEDILLDNFIPTASVMFRSGLIRRLPDWVNELKMGDWPMLILTAHHGKIGYIDEAMSVYLVHHAGVWSMKDEHFIFLAILEMYEALDKHLGVKFTWITSRILRGRYFVESMRQENIGDLTKAIYYTIKSINKDLLIIIEPIRLTNRDKSYFANALPHVVYVSSAQLIRRVLKLHVTLLRSLLSTYLVPILRIYFPPLYKFLRVIARRQDLRL